MKRIFVLIISVITLLPTGAKADEGMWLPMFIERLNYVDMQNEGLKLTPKEIYDVNNSSIKDAIVNFGGYCTGEVISDQGLILTNHHCGYSTIAELSTEEHDYLTDGFWAHDKSEELKPEKLFVSFLVRMEDVTNDIQSQLGDIDEKSREEKIKQLKQDIIKQKTEGTNFRAEIKDFYKGNEFYLFIYQDYHDVRLVGTPPSSIGKFGGDTDNWMWPRHTGDFSIYRVYGDKDGNPAEYSKDNVPLKPKHHLPINLNDKKEGDFAMVLGYPGSTKRYLPSWGVEQAIDVEYPAHIKITEAKLKIMKRYMDGSDKIRIDYASSYAGIANYWKNRIGMIKALTKLNTVSKKQDIEKQFTNWVNSDSSRKEKYGDALQLFQKYYTETNDYIKSYTLLRNGALRKRRDLAKFVIEMDESLANYTEGDNTKRAEMRTELEEKINTFFDKHNMDLEKEVLAVQLNIYSSDASKEYQPSSFVQLTEKQDGDFTKYTEKMFAKSIYVNKGKLEDFLDKPNLKYIENDKLGNLFTTLSDHMDEMKAGVEPLEYKKKEAYRLFLAGLREMNPDKAYAPDANFTMRLTYGQVLPYDVRDAVKYNFTTTIEGIMQKMDNSDPEFVVPEKLVELYNAKDYGQYANSKGELIVGFLSDNDITGGNSGSPVIDGNGNLIGTAFDGNWEAMSGDIEFEENLQRTISVDIRYTLFIIDKFAGAKNLIDEMTIIKN